MAKSDKRDTSGICTLRLLGELLKGGRKLNWHMLLVFPPLPVWNIDTMLEREHPSCDHQEKAKVISENSDLIYLTTKTVSAIT